MEFPSSLLGVLVAALGGAAVGAERQQSGHTIGSAARFGGIRTFTLLGLTSGLAGWLTTIQLAAFGAVLLAGAIALVLVGYAAASRRDVDGTTEAAGLVVIGAGAIAGVGWLALASGIIAVCTLLLVEKSRLHAFVGKIDDDELRAAARFGVMAIVILPLLPAGPFGPFGGIRPQQLWTLVLFFTGLSFAGYLARRTFGAQHGYPVAGLLAGLISSTSLTLTFARNSREDAAHARPLAVGTIAACTMLFPRVLIATTVLSPVVGRALLPYVVAPVAVGVMLLVVWWRRSADTSTAPGSEPSNPLQILPALQMALVFQVVLFVVEGARTYFGTSGLLVSGAVLGLTDVDALTISMSRTTDTGVSAAVAAQAIAVGILTNGLLKTALALVLGGPPFRGIAGLALATMAAASAGALLWLR